MKRIGILGGISHESTAVYYTRLHSAHFARTGNYHYPEVVIYSLNFQRFTDYEDQGDLAGYVAYIMTGVTALTQAGVDFILMAANSPHAVFDQVAAQSSVPMLSIVEVTAQAAHRQGLQSLLLLGIRFTMQSTFYQEVCARHGIAVTTPAVADQERINQIIFDELVVGEFKDASRQELLAIMARHRVDGVILGCTELPLILRPTDAPLPLLDTLTLHVQATLDYAAVES